MTDVFSVEYFAENLRKHVELNGEFNDRVDAMNSYYRSIVSTLINEKLSATSETLHRIRNLDEAYTIIKSQEF
ncbi:protein YvfG [Bacillus suaedaesalsae]|uniref:Protein YvfG n=1 Tax=Bacillus suaedaesalsae TaxID=2810349 RepID=A0ABS2DKG9_9BACI|nr:protein YvfG [Bacillus suaedaesalsae]MBM6618999.1 protein YvfG [Bacillus suaedaesalsae]